MVTGRQATMAFKMLILILLAAGSAQAAKFRVVMMSDTHCIGPQYEKVGARQGHHTISMS